MQHPSSQDDDVVDAQERAILLGLEVGLRQHATLLFKTLNSAAKQEKNAALDRFRAGVQNLLETHDNAADVVKQLFETYRAIDKELEEANV